MNKCIFTVYFAATLGPLSPYQLHSIIIIKIGGDPITFRRFFTPPPSSLPTCQRGLTDIVRVRPAGTAQEKEGGGDRGAFNISSPILK